MLKETNTPTRPRIEPGSPDPESDALTIRPVRPPAVEEANKERIFELARVAAEEANKERIFELARIETNKKREIELA